MGASRGGVGFAGSPAASTMVLGLDDPRASDPGWSGAKAANLAKSAAAGLPVIPGFVITTAAGGGLTLPATPDTELPVVRMWAALSAGGTLPLAVRFSSTVADSPTFTIAGHSLSTLDVKGWDAFVAACNEVRMSRSAAELGDLPIAILVQQMADARVGGVLFGLNPLTGGRNRLLAYFAQELPRQLLRGAVPATAMTIGRFGRIRSVSGPDAAGVAPDEARALARLAWLTRRLFGVPQEMEWLIEPDGDLRLLRTHPVSAPTVHAIRSRLLGPGALAGS